MDSGTWGSKSQGMLPLVHVGILAVSKWDFNRVQTGGCVDGCTVPVVVSAGKPLKGLCTTASEYGLVCGAGKTWMLAVRLFH
jgi:hypothetical protein